MDIGSDLFGSVGTAISNAPLAVLTIGLLVGPTVLWFVLRMAFPSGKKKVGETGRMLWACPNCHSVNESVQVRCYACKFEPLDEVDVTVIDPLTGRPMTPAITRSWGDRAAQPMPTTAAAGRAPVAVGPGRAAATGGSPSVASADPMGAGARPGTTTPAATRVLKAIDAKRPFDAGVPVATGSRVGAGRPSGSYAGER